MSTWQDLKDNPRLKKIYEQKITILRLIREWFWAQGFLETPVPSAIKYAGQEPYLNPVPVSIHDTRNTTHQFYLHTSPEYALKKLLAAGFGNIFWLGSCWRNNESFGGTHNPEFLMLEWYRSPGTYLDFMDDLESLFKFVGKNLGIEILPARGGSALGGKYGNREIKVFEPWDRMTMRNVWQKYVGVNLDEYLQIERLKDLVIKLGYQASDDDAYEDLFFKIFLNKIEPHLGLERPVFIYDYPIHMASLSRPCEYDPRYAERVECYVGGLELCNGFGELTDADEQKRRLEADRALRIKLGKPTWPVDQDFIAAIKSGFGTRQTAGLPAIVPTAVGTAAGVALGVDRMVLLFTGAYDINEVIFSSVADQLNV